MVEAVFYDKTLSKNAGFWIVASKRTTSQLAPAPVLRPCAVVAPPTMTDCLLAHILLRLGIF
jgi:hypothetical protein